MEEDNEIRRTRGWLLIEFAVAAAASGIAALLAYLHFT